MSDRERWVVYPLLFFALMMGLAGQLERTGILPTMFEAAEPPLFNELHCRRLVLKSLDNRPLAVLTENLDGDPQLLFMGDKGPAAILRADAGGGRLLLVRDGEDEAIFLGHDANRPFSGATVVELNEGRILPLDNAVEVPLGREASPADDQAD